MAEFNDLQRLLVEINLMAFYQDGDVCKIEDETLDLTLQKYYDVLTELRQGEHSHQYNQTIEDAQTAINQFENSIKNLTIDMVDMRNYQRNNKKSKSIEEYHNIKEKLTRDMIPILKYDDYENWHTEPFIAKETKRKTGSRKVLNKHNPFADISIQNQQFLFADDDGFKTLSFTTGYTMTKITGEDDDAIIALQPGFKISKSTDRQSLNQKSDIAMDDTLTTPVKESSNDIELIYI